MRWPYVFIAVCAVAALTLGFSTVRCTSFVREMDALDWSISEEDFVKGGLGIADGRQSIVERDGDCHLYSMKKMTVGNAFVDPIAVFREGRLIEVEAEVPAAEDAVLADVALKTAKAIGKELDKKAVDDGGMYVFILGDCMVIVADEMIFARPRAHHDAPGTKITVRQGIDNKI